MNRRDLLAFGGASALTLALPRPASARTGISMIKMVFVGDHHIGKSSMLVSYTTNRFPVEGIATGFDTLTAHLVYQGQPTQLELTDTPGAEDYDRVRPLSYPGADVVGLGFSLTDRSSFEAVTQRWLPEIRHHLPGAPIILIGMKADLRHDPSWVFSDPVPREECEALAAQIGAVAYQENSAVTQAGLAQTFQALMAAARGEPVDRSRLPTRRQIRPGQNALTPARRPTPRRGGN
ncbi:Rho family protein [Maricaulis sp.]|uniref:Rho family protein n=1 Tax=Maricaulis sp. TaxID=1486257 RepID=UPI003A8DC78B|tara:strand:- start:7420 stop:8124 length:705 start_codon:yes stop_codon:yes gene_type:complete